MIMVDKFNHVFNESTIFLRISFISSSMTLVIFLIGFFTPSWKYVEFNLDFNGLSAANEKINHLDEEVKVENSNGSNELYLYDSMEQERNLSSLDEIDLYALLTKNSVNQSLLRSLIDEPSMLYTAQVNVGLWKTIVCTKVQTEEHCLEPFETQGYTWIRRSRGFCILALGMSLLTVILILMCLFLSIAADMLLTHVMTLLTSVISVSSIVVGILIFTTNHMKLDEITTVSNNFGKLQVPISKVSWACWLSASAAPTAAMTVLFLGLNIVFF